MITKFMCVVASLATTSLFIGATEVQAQGYVYTTQGYGAYRPSTQFYTYPSSSQPLYSSSFYGNQPYAPYGAYSPVPRYSSGYQYSNPLRYSSGYGYRGSSSYLGGSRYYTSPSRSGISIRVGTSGFGNRGFGLRRGF